MGSASAEMASAVVASAKSASAAEASAEDTPSCAGGTAGVVVIGRVAVFDNLVLTVLARVGVAYLLAPGVLVERLRVGELELVLAAMGTLLRASVG